MEQKRVEYDFKPSVLIFNVYLINNWKQVSKKLLSDIPHNDIYINVSVDWYRISLLFVALPFFKKIPKVKRVFITLNKKRLAEVSGFEKLKKNIDWQPYQLLTYMHGKGVTKPRNENVHDWVELMRYFVIERMDICQQSFCKGYKLYGVNLAIPKPEDINYGPYQFSGYHFSGNFISVNLKELKEKFLSTPVDRDYFGVEGFWGKLCGVENVYCAYESKIDNHYLQPYPEHIYKQDGRNQENNQEQ